MKKKVAFFVVGLNAGGIENYLLRFLIHYRNDIKPIVYCKSGNSGDLENEYKNEGISIKLIKVGYFNPFDLNKIKKDLLEEHVDAVVDFTGNFSGLIMFLCKNIGIKKRITWYRNADDKFKKTKLRIAYNKLLNYLTKLYATDILSNSKAAFNYFYKSFNWQNDSRFEVIHNGIDSEKFLITKSNVRSELNIPTSAFVVGNIGRFNEQKNHQTAIKVAIDLCNKYDDIYFIFCGKGVDDEYGTQIRNIGLSGRIILTGMRRDIIQVLNTMNCFYFPSILEGQPNALIEAMVAGVPFVASNIEPVKETVPLNIHQYLVPPLDENEAKLRILKIKNDAQYREMFLLKNWAVQHFNSEVQFKKFYNKIYS